MGGNTPMCFLRAGLSKFCLLGRHLASPSRCNFQQKYIINDEKKKVFLYSSSFDRLATHKLLVSVNAVVDLELLSTTFADNWVPIQILRV